MPTASLIFCDACSSERVDVAGSKGARDREYRIRCFACGAEATLQGFTLGRAGQDTMRMTPFKP